MILMDVISPNRPNLKTTPPTRSLGHATTLGLYLLFKAPDSLESISSVHSVDKEPT